MDTAYYYGLLSDLKKKKILLKMDNTVRMQPKNEVAEDFTKH